MPGNQELVARSRVALLVMTFFSFFILSSQRHAMSLLVVDMANYTALDERDKEACYTSDSEHGSFDWNISLQINILSSYFLGLAVTFLPAELLATKLSCAKWAIFAGTLIASLCNLLTPLGAIHDVHLLMVIQVIKASAQAVLIPSLSVTIRQCVPVKELISFMACTTTAMPLGAFFTSFFAGVLCSYRREGWTDILYITGAIGITWCLLWLYLVHDFQFFPFLEIYSQTVVVTKGQELPIPWNDILLSRYVWAYIGLGIAWYGSFSFNLLLLPMFVRSVYKLNIAWNGIVSSFPSLIEAFLYFISVMLSHRLILKNQAKKESLRKMITCAGLFINTIAMIMLMKCSCNRAMGVLLLIMAIGSSGLVMSTLTLIPSDMTYNFAGVLSGMMNSIGALSGLVFPACIGYIGPPNTNYIDWSKGIFASAFISVSFMVLFLGFGSCKTQPWNKPKIEKAIRSSIAEVSANDEELENIESTDSNSVLTKKKY